MVELNSNPQNVVQISNNMAKHYSDLASASATQAQNCLLAMQDVEANILQEMIDNKVIVTKLSDLENDLGFISSIPEEYITFEELDTMGFLTFVPPGYVTVEELEAKGYLTEHQDISNLVTKDEIPDVSNKADKATTLNGYGITDAYTKQEIDSIIGNIDTILDEVIE